MWMSHLKQFVALGERKLIFFDVIECVIGIMGSFTNIMVLVAIAKERRLRTITNCFVGSLAASDVLVGLAVPPLVILSNEQLPLNFSVCVLINSLVVLLTNISVLNLLSVALERFVAIRKPFTYHYWMSIDRALYLVAATWLVAIFIGLVPVMGWNKGEEGYEKCTFNKVISLEYLVYFIFFVITLLPLIAMISIYVYIFRVVRKTKRVTATFMVSEGKDRLKETIKKNTRGDLSILLVILLFVLCWMPLHIANCILLFSDYKVPSEIYHTCNALSRFNSLVNPFLFAFGYTRFKVAIKKIMCKRWIKIEDDLSDGPDKRRTASRTEAVTAARELELSSFRPSSFMQSPGEQEQPTTACPERKERTVDTIRAELCHTLSPTDSRGQEAAPAMRHKTLDGTMVQSIDDNSFLFSVVDMMSDEVIWEIGHTSHTMTSGDNVQGYVYSTSGSDQSSHIKTTNLPSILNRILLQSPTPSFSPIPESNEPSD